MHDPKDTFKALLLPFRQDHLPMPERAFLLRAEAGDDVAEEWRDILVCEQGFKPAYDRLIAKGWRVFDRITPALAEAETDGRGFATGLVVLTKHKAENRANIARGLSLLQPGGILVCSGANALGAASLERDVDREIGLQGHISKYQARTFWLRRPEHDSPAPAILEAWQAAGAPSPIGETGWVARPGTFSADKIDRGSEILAGCLPEAIAGRVADLGAGWGYLSVRLLQSRPEITSIDLYEAEAAALDDARTNLAALVPERAALATCHWHDVQAPLVDVAPYDWIISNPPFHVGGQTNAQLGQSFITAAWKAIRRRGKFVMVANRHLPYEAELRRRFRSVEQILDADGFKVMLATNRHDK